MATMLARLEALGEAILPNRRKAPRTMVQVGAKVTSSHGQSTAMTIANISVHGCNIAGDAAWLRLGSFVTVSLNAGGEAMQAIVRWVRDGSAGLEFLRPVPPGHAEWHELISSIAEM